MSNPTDLVSLAAVQAFSGITANPSFTASLITSVSRQILTTLNRPNILPAAYTETLDGNDQRRMMLRNWPVLAVSEVIVDHMVIVPAESPAAIGDSPSFPNYGYLLSTWDGLPPGMPQFLYMKDWRFYRGGQNVVVSYTAGYQASETQTVAGGTLTAAQLYGAWTTDHGVVYASTGLALTEVASGPTQGQYAVAAGVYTFNAADDGQSVILSYGYIPADLANAAAQWVSELLVYQGHIGTRSKTLGGQETVTYIVGAIPPIVAGMIQPYRRVAPQ